MPDKDFNYSVESFYFHMPQDENLRCRFLLNRFYKTELYLDSKRGYANYLF